MIFTVAIISPSTTGLNAGSVASVTASSMRLSRSIASLSSTSTPGRFGEQIAAPGEGAVGAHALALDGRGDIGGGLILRHVAGFQPRHHDFLDARRLQRGHFRRPDQRALLEHEIALADRMHRGGAERIAGATGPNFMPPPPCPPSGAAAR